ncbi:hypothetical protein [Pseudomonas abieticivorans]|uniref:hypothetical protein n=1 Tax=Pseudomonas abieticivorans TaxID=2931382 RepID=UPI0020C0339C|nr:hypothetical protein [Pseudomonas sp. PIA16]
MNIARLFPRSRLQAFNAPLASLSAEQLHRAAIPVSPRLLAPLGIPIGENIPVIVDDGLGNEVPGQAGVNIALLSSGNGLLVRVPTWLTMNQGDVVHVFWGSNSVPAVSKILEPEDVNKENFLYVPHAVIQGGQASVFHRVIRTDGGVADESTPIQVLVKLTLPGGYDPVAGEPGHQNLLPPTVPVDKVLPEHLVSGLDITLARYQNIRIRDTITLSWGGQPVTYTLTQADIDGNAPIIVHVPGSVIREASDSLRLEVIYKIIDEVQNQSIDGNDLPWSMARYVEVEVGQDLLEEPYSEEFYQAVIDLDVLGTRDLDIEIYLAPSQFTPGDSVTLTWAGRTVDDAPVEFDRTQTVPAGRVMHFIIENAEARKLPSGRVRLSYTRTKASNGSVNRSRSATWRIVGQVLELPAPSVLEARGSALDPSLTYATVQIPPWLGMYAGQPLTMIWTGTTLGGSLIYFEDHTAVSSNEVDTLIDRLTFAKDILPLGGSTVQVYYLVTINGTVRQSDALTLNVGIVPGTLKAPSVLEEFDGYLDPEKLIGNRATLLIEHDGVIRANDKLTVYWTGSTTRLYSDNTLAGSGTSSQIYIPISQISPNLNGLVIALYRVERAGAIIGTSRELILPVGSGTQQPWLAPTVEDASNLPANPLDPIISGPPVQDNTATVVVRDSRILAGDTVGVAWILPDGTGLSVPYQNAVAGSAGLPVPALVLTQSMGRIVQVGYAIYREPGQQLIGTSAVLALQVLQMPFGELPAPAISEADATDVLDLGTFQGDATVTVAKWPRSATGQRVWLEAHGTLASNNAAIRIELLTRQITQNEATNGLRVAFSRNTLESLKEGTLTLKLWVAYNGATSSTEALAFPEATFTLRQGLVSLPAPTVVGAPNGSLNPIDALNGATVRVTYADMRTTDTITVTWTGTPGAGTPVIGSKPGLLAGTVEFAIPDSAVGANVGATVRVRYSVLRGNTPLDSAELPLAVSTIPATYLPKPAIIQTNGV